MTFSPVWDTIVRQNRPDGASTATSTATERTPSAESVRGRGAGDGPTSGPGDGRGSLPATEGQRERSSALNMGGTTRVRRSRPVTGDESAFLRPESWPGDGLARRLASPDAGTPTARPVGADIIRPSSVRRAAIHGGRPVEARPPAGAYAAGAPLLMSKAGGKPAGRGISIPRVKVATPGFLLG